MRSARIFLIAIILFVMSTKAYGQDNVKRPNVSGQFYSSNPKQLSEHIDLFFSAAKVEPYSRPIQVIIAPHAGYVYSGPVAAYGYKAASRQAYSTIVVLAPSHHVDFSGISVWPQGKFETPLGLVDVDEDFSGRLLKADASFQSVPQAFQKEHALEVQIPFLQKTFKDFKIVPVVMGNPSPSTSKALGDALNTIMGDRKDVLIVVSTDMSHYHPASEAGKMDAKAVDFVKNLDAEALMAGCSLGTTELCGVAPVTAAIYFAKARGLKADILHYADSGDIIGDKSSVVGYFSAVFYGEAAQKEEPAPAAVSDLEAPLTAAQKKRLLEIARSTMTVYIKTGKAPEVQEADPRLQQDEGAFVTIHLNGELRGCIGNIIGQGPLYQTVHDMAVASSTQDPRFPPVSKNEVDKLEIEISVLSKPRRVKSPDEVQPGVHGVIVSKGFFNKGVFLPQVATEQGWGREEFLSNLCLHKAGLSPDAWKDPSVVLEVFTAQVFSEKDLKP